MPTVYTLDGERVNVLHSVDAREYVASGLYSWHPPRVDEKPVSIVIYDTAAEAFAALDPDNPDLWTQGKPKLSALNALLDHKLIAEERDTAWAEYQSAE